MRAEHDHATPSGEREHAPDVHRPLDAAAWAASSIGNRAFSQIVARAGAGLLPDGTLHPDVQAAIARASGAGTALDAGVRDRFAEPLGDALSDVRVHADDRADALAASVEARAFATGSDIFFARGEYRPRTSAGDQLLAHELTHVVQQRGAPRSGPLTVSQPGDACELEAEAVAEELSG
jgi:hypothetical protein